MKPGPRFVHALSYAATLHGTQVQKGSNIPYISHLLGVTSIVLDHGGDEDEAIAALLHDAVEDQGGEATLAVIRATYGEWIGSIVLECTDAMSMPKPPWKERKVAYLADIPHKSRSGRLVSVSDKLYNARAILDDIAMLGDTDAFWSRFTGGRSGSLWYYRALAVAYEMAGDNTGLVTKFRTAVDALPAD